MPYKFRRQQTRIKIFICFAMFGNYQFVTARMKFLTIFITLLTSVSVAGIYLLLVQNAKSDADNYPIVINTWAFTNANRYAWEVLLDEKSALDAVEIGCITCEREQCDGTVGYGGSPDENGETTQDAMIMDGMTMNVGAVGALRNIKDAVSVARHVLEHTRHSFLVGDQATEFAVQMGFKKESLSTDVSKSMWHQWNNHNCQPNFWLQVSPDPSKSCGPYNPTKSLKNNDNDNTVFDEYNHDTIGIAAIDKFGNIAAATSSNGARHKIPGRVGDAPIVGSGAYAEKDVGAAAATGDGDIMMRFLPSFKAVENLKNGFSAEESAKLSLKNIIKYYPKFTGGLVVVNANGEFGAACFGLKSFPYTVSHSKLDRVATVYNVNCIPAS